MTNGIMRHMSLRETRDSRSDFIVSSLEVIALHCKKINSAAEDTTAYAGSFWTSEQVECEEFSFAVLIRPIKTRQNLTSCDAT